MPQSSCSRVFALLSLPALLERCSSLRTLTLRIVQGRFIDTMTRSPNDTVTRSSSVLTIISAQYLYTISASPHRPRQHKSPCSFPFPGEDYSWQAHEDILEIPRARGSGYN
ncbi:hypothetical protein BDN67DRAFT_264290 [Paxillus ammoniavirescens]|nr:hypothetical protein BDN67DRAFT_264290 [Paxillus ammoniavirescens]